MGHQLFDTGRGQPGKPAGIDEGGRGKREGRYEAVVVAMVGVGEGAKEGKCRVRRSTHEEEVEIRARVRGKIGGQGEGLSEKWKWKLLSYGIAQEEHVVCWCAFSASEIKVPSRVTLRRYVVRRL